MSKMIALGFGISSYVKNGIEQFAAAMISDSKITYSV